MSLTQAQAKRIAAAAMAETKFGDLRVRVSASQTGNARFARSGPTTEGDVEELNVEVTAATGDGRHATARGNRTDQPGLAALVQRAEAMAELAPVDPEWMPPLGPQTYPKVSAFDRSTARLDADDRVGYQKAVIEAARGGDIDVSGFLQHSDLSQYVADRSGLAGYQRGTALALSCTCRTSDGTGSGRRSFVSHQRSRLPSQGATLARDAAAWARKSQNPVAVDPGKYTVVLAPEAVSSLLEFLSGAMSHRSAVEGRSYFSAADGKTKIGQALFGSNITLRSDPTDKTNPASAIASDGRPQNPTDWIVGGKLLALTANRFWADKMGVVSRPRPSSLHLSGGTQTLDELIAGVDRGIFVSRFWYNRMLSRRTIVATGLTRDGTFLIEGGKLSKPIKNFRYNDSPITMLTRAVAMGVPERVGGIRRASVVPPIVVDGFNFESTSDAI